MGDDIKVRYFVITAQINGVPSFIHMDQRGNYDFKNTLKGSALFRPHEVQKFIKAAAKSCPHKMIPQAVK